METKERQIDFELLEELIDCAKREVKKRYAVYPPPCGSGKNDRRTGAQRTKNDVRNPEGAPEDL